MSCSGFLVLLFLFGWLCLVGSFLAVCGGFFGAVGGVCVLFCCFVVFCWISLGFFLSSGRLCEGRNALFFRICLYE